MIQLSTKAIEEFKKIYSAEFRVDLSNEDANKLGVELLEFMKMIYRPVPNNRGASGQQSFKGDLTLVRGFYSL